jgi:HK97 family phage prohead protease
MARQYDFSGYATRTNLRCSDGRTIMKDAFKDCDGKKVPLVWNHQRATPYDVLGHAILENREDGVYAYCSFNETEDGKHAKALVQHGDITALSIYANQLQQQGGNVMHGTIREVSLVYAGANPGASIQEVIRHGDVSEEEAVIFTGEEFSLYHSADDDKTQENGEGAKKMAEEKKTPKENESEETVADVWNTLSEKQKTVVYAMIGQALEEAQGKDKDDSEGDEKMRHNVFDQDERDTGNVICHADQQMIMADAKRVGSFKAAMEMYAADNQLMHDDESADVSGFVDGSLEMLFPEYKDVRTGAPELVTYDQGWVTLVMNKIHKSPYSRIRTRQVDIRTIDALKAKGYKKGEKKALSGNYAMARRTTDPQTLYVRSTLNRDDIVDITDFDYVAYQYKIDRLQLNETLAMSVMIGDGREDDDPDKIYPDKIRPIWTDDELFTIHVDVDIDAARDELQGTTTADHFGDNYVYAEAIITASLYAREQYKGSGNVTFFCDPHLLNVMTLARDRNGRRIYANKSDLAAALNVSSIETVEQFAGKVRHIAATATTEAASKKLLGIFVNLDDYSLGSTKGGEITHFNQFDIDFNQEKSLLETRCSGALTRIKSAIVLEEPVASN